MTDTLATTATSGPGRTRITARALDRVVSAVTSDELGVAARRVDVDLQDDGGPLTLVVEAPMRVLALGTVANDPEAIARGGGSLMERAAAAQESIRRRVRELTGSDISRIRLQITTAEITARARVS